MKDLEAQLLKLRSEYELIIKERTEFENQLRRLGGDWDSKDKDYRRAGEQYISKVSVLIT